MTGPQSSALAPTGNSGGSPFDQIRRTDAYGREYWSARELQPLMGYVKWERFEGVIERAVRSAKNTGTYSEQHFSQTREATSRGDRGAGQKRDDFRLSRHAAYLVALNGDPNKSEVAAAQAYFVRRTREAELGAITIEEVRRTALARAREMVDYRTFRDMMAGNAPDYEPSSKASRIFFATTQNKLYRHLTGMTAEEIKNARELIHWKGREEGKPEPGPKSACRKVAKNYLTCSELQKLDRLVSRLCLRAEDIAEDGLRLSLTQWDYLLDMELTLLHRPIAA